MRIEVVAVPSAADRYRLALVALVQVKSVGVTELMDHATLPKYSRVVACITMGSGASTNDSRTDAVMEPPGHQESKCSPGAIRPFAHDRCDGHGSCPDRTVTGTAKGVE
jgi:hypothetical protein